MQCEPAARLSASAVLCPCSAEPELPAEEGDAHLDRTTPPLPTAPLTLEASDSITTGVGTALYRAPEQGMQERCVAARTRPDLPLAC